MPNRKVFARLFQKAAGWRGGALPRPSQWAKHPSIPKAQEGRPNRPGMVWPWGTLARGSPSFPLPACSVLLSQPEILSPYPFKRRPVPCKSSLESAGRWAGYKTGTDVYKRQLFYQLTMFVLPCYTPNSQQGFTVILHLLSYRKNKERCV